MNSLRIIFKNLSALFIAQAITSLLTPLLLIFIARTLGDEIFGKYSYILSLTAIFLIIANFGIKGVAIRDIARDPSKLDAYVKNTFLLKLLLSTITISILILFIKLMNMPRDTTLASYVFAGGLFFQSMSHAFRWVFHALQVMEKEAILRVTDRFFLLLFSVVVIWSGWGLMALSYAFLAAQIIVFFLSFYLLSRITSVFPGKINIPLSKYLMKTAVFFALCEVLWMIYFKIDMVMLAKIKGETEVGWYSAGYVIVNYITLISMLSMQVLFPVLSTLYQKQIQRLKQATEHLFRYLTFSAMLIVPLIFFLSDKIIMLIYGPEYSESIRALKILIFVVIFLFPGNLFAQVLASSNRHKSLAAINFFGVALNISLNLILIPKYGFFGAGIATIITEIFLCFTLYAVVFKFLRFNTMKTIFRLLPGIAAMTAVLTFFKNIHWLPVVSAAALLYLSLGFLTKTIRKEDFSILSGLAGKKTSPDFWENS
jgi:O-antigen/teichoic acid export membrane protein